MISTFSPTCFVFPASCALMRVVRLKYLRYLGCRTNRATRTTTVSFIFVDTTVPESTRPFLIFNSVCICSNTITIKQFNNISKNCYTALLFYCFRRLTSVSIRAISFLTPFPSFTFFILLPDMANRNARSFSRAAASSPCNSCSFLSFIFYTLRTYELFYEIRNYKWHPCFLFVFRTGVRTFVPTTFGAPLWSSPAVSRPPCGAPPKRPLAPLRQFQKGRARVPLGNSIPAGRPCLCPCRLPGASR